ncbi:MAG: hypothetical protein ACYC9Q_10900 [Bacillota bacterium]
MFEFLHARRKEETKTSGRLAVDRLRWVLAHDRAECWGDRAVRLAKKTAAGREPQIMSGARKPAPVTHKPEGEGEARGE